MSNTQGLQRLIGASHVYVLYQGVIRIKMHLHEVKCTVLSCIQLSWSHMYLSLQGLTYLASYLPTY